MSFWHTTRKTLAIFEMDRPMAFFKYISILGFATVLEIAGIGVVLPILGAVFEPNGFDNIPFAREVASFLGASTNQMRWMVLISLPVFFSFKSGAVMGAYLILYRSVYQRQRSLMRRLYAGFLNMPYAEHLVRNSAETQRDVLHSTSVTMGGALLPLLNIALESMVTVGIIILLVSIEPTTTIISSVILLILSAFLFKIISPLLEKWGKNILRLEGCLLGLVGQSMNGIAEIKIHGNKNFFEDVFDDETKDLVEMRAKNQVLLQSPRFCFEVVTITLIAIILIFTLKEDGGVTGTIPMLGLFMAAALRLIPAMHRSVQLAGNIKASTAAVESLYDNLQQFKASGEDQSTSTAQIDFKKTISLEGISYGYKASSCEPSVPVLENLDLTIKHGERIALVGPSGSGKTSLILVLMGLLQHEQGAIKVDGKTIDTRERAWRSKIGYVPQSIFLLDDTLRNNIAFGADEDRISSANIEQACKRAQLDDFINTRDGGLDADIGEQGKRLSGGQRQRVGIARAICHNPEILILDEATSGLDQTTERAINRTLESLSSNMTIIVIAHRLESIRNFDNIVFMKSGQILQMGTYDALIQTCPAFRGMVHDPAASCADDVE
tara:strand:- start:885 stop:2714 length:1830 start_codon:yes stop_codon:yes gene_type:complete